MFQGGLGHCRQPKEYLAPMRSGAMPWIGGLPRRFTAPAARSTSLPRPLLLSGINAGKFSREDAKTQRKRAERYHTTSNECDIRLTYKASRI